MTIFMEYPIIFFGYSLMILTLESFYSLLLSVFRLRILKNFKIALSMLNGLQKK